MKNSFSKEYLFQNSGCYRTERGGDIETILEDVQEPITLEQILNSNIPIKDKYWFVCRKLATKEQNQQIAIGVAEIVLHLFENKYPEDKRPRKAIEAAKKYLVGNIGLLDLRDAADAYDAYDAADAAAYAALAAAAYAYNAAYAALAADAAAYAYYAAANAAANAAADGALKKILFNFLIEFCNKTEDETTTRTSQAH